MSTGQSIVRTPSLGGFETQTTAVCNDRPLGLQVASALFSTPLQVGATAISRDTETQCGQIAAELQVEMDQIRI